MKNFAKSLLAALLLCLAGFSTTIHADIKIKTKNTAANQSAEYTTYIKGKRQRSEYGEIATITQCDLRRTVTLNASSATYTIELFDLGNDAAVNRSGAASSGGATPISNARRGGTVTNTITVVDTGERRQMFGYTARHIKTIFVAEPSPDACSQDKSRVETDGWYIDFAFDFNCANTNPGASQYATARADGCQDEYRTKQIGKAKIGYPVLLTMTIFDDSGKAIHTSTQEVTELSATTLDAQLFDAPANFKLVTDRNELYAAKKIAAGAADSAVNDAAANSSTANSIAANDSARTPTNRLAAATTLGAKKPGVVRIGIAATRVTSVGEGLNAATLSEVVRGTLTSYLTGPSIETIAIEARLPQQIELEAKQKECDYVVYTTAAHKKGGGGGFGSFLKKAAPVIDVVPVGGAASSTAGAIAEHTTRTAIYTAANVANSVKSKDELTLEYKVQPTAGGVPVATKTLKKKAKADGDDILSELIEQAASETLGVAMQR